MKVNSYNIFEKLNYLENLTYNQEEKSLNIKKLLFIICKKLNLSHIVIYNEFSYDEGDKSLFFIPNYENNSGFVIELNDNFLSSDENLFSAKKRYIKHYMFSTIYDKITKVVLEKEDQINKNEVSYCKMLAALEKLFWKKKTR